MTVILGDPTYDLDTLNQLLKDQENFLQGPLTKIGNDGTSTTLDIDDTQNKPAKNAVITTGNSPAGATQINSDKIFISGTLTEATAYRPA